LIFINQNDQSNGLYFASQKDHPVTLDMLKLTCPKWQGIFLPPPSPQFGFFDQNSFQARNSNSEPFDDANWHPLEEDDSKHQH